MPAEASSAAVYGAARAALPVNAGLGVGEQTLHLGELGVGGLQLGGFAGNDVEAVVVTDGHLVCEPAEVPGERGDASSQLRLPSTQLGERAWLEGACRRR